MDTVYEIETKLRSGEWSNEDVPPSVGGHNEFDTEAEARAAITRLKEIDEDWAVAEYRVVEWYLPIFAPTII